MTNFAPSGPLDAMRRTTRMRAPMRSSIACLRCRKSKIKCDNNGTSGPCETCVKIGHKCQYPDLAMAHVKRLDPPIGIVRVDEKLIHDKKRAKRGVEAPVSDSYLSEAYAVEVLSYPFLTSEVWDQVFIIFKLHYGTELSFLHLPTLREKLSRNNGKYETTPDLNLVLLGILTLTARFHSELVKYVAHVAAYVNTNPRQRTISSKTGPSSASEFFANALTTAVGPLGRAMTKATIERAQAFLMLGLYEWSQRRPDSGLAAWMYVGVATRLAQALEFGSEDTLHTHLEARNATSPQGTRLASVPSEVGITKEVKRRTMFSCLVLDRMLASGYRRPSMMRSEDLMIQLPCTEMAFDLALDVHTGYLRPGSSKQPCLVTDDSVLRRFVQLADIWGEIAKYSISGGRLTEDMVPWDERSKFKRLRDDLDFFVGNLPETFTLSRQNFYRHDNHQATCMYVSLHMLSSLSQIILNREWLPFIPLQCQYPEGIADSTMAHAGQAPGGYWEDTADRVFRAARRVADLVEIARDKLPYSSLTMFTTWTARFVSLYAQHFPSMDVKGHARGIGFMVGATQEDHGGPLAAVMNKINAHFEGAQASTEFLRTLDGLYLKAKADLSVLSRGYGYDNLGRLGGGYVAEAKKPHVQTQAIAEMALGLTIEQKTEEPAEGTRVVEASSDLQPVTPLGFTAIKNPGPGHGGVGPYGDGEPIAETWHARTQGPPDRLERRVAAVLRLRGAFSMDELNLLESQRLGAVMSDVREFTGAGVLGEEWCDRGQTEFVSEGS
ncbi:hypothetical protein S40293_01232 [Stachybotrys chartarum IBT 40293]|nr:hypothetical protein S40293_01232 [Stachybotrys chartarum IBT 40293]